MVTATMMDTATSINPDVRYRDGYPGESCYNSVMPGIQEVLSRGYVDEKRIGAQGHSWGGYQVAYLATRTRLFAAIESGAPVYNMPTYYYITNTDFVNFLYAEIYKIVKTIVF